MVVEYEQMFSELSEFASTMVATNADRCKKFQDGLHVSIRDRLTTLDTDDFIKWVNMAIKAEQNLKEMKDRDEKFRKKKGQYFGEDGQPKKSYSEDGVSSHKPSRFQGGSDKRPSMGAPSRTIIGPQ